MRKPRTSLRQGNTLGRGFIPPKDGAKLRHLLRVCGKVLLKGCLSVRKYSPRRWLDLYANRRRLSLRYISGVGLEIGALSKPLQVADGVVVRYVDRIGRAEAIRRHPEMDVNSIVDPDYIHDGFVLPSVSDSSQDFVIANHVLEHAPNPVQALRNWRRVVRPNGIVFVSVPIAAKCFDRGRTITGIEHLFEDDRLCSRGEMEQFKERNKAHYAEWLRISRPNALAKRGEDYRRPADDEIRSQIETMAAACVEIHFHTFSVQSFSDFVRVFAASNQTRMKVETVQRNRGEVIAILRKGDNGAGGTGASPVS